ncbi:MAG: hypothetical protein ACODAJ_01160 [Planctomycetota bacterium]
MFRFPARVFNERIAVFVDAFYEEMARLYAAQSWPWEEPSRSEGHWEHPDFEVHIARRHKDGAARTLEIELRHLPGIRSVAGEEVSLADEHRFRVNIPWAYPNKLGQIVVRAMSRLYHPRIGASGKGEACIHVNGEIDRVLLSIVRQILLDPAYVQPPSLYRGQDRGMNLAAMNWFEANPHGYHRRLLQLWAQAHGKKDFEGTDRPAPKVRVEQADS